MKTSFGALWRLQSEEEQSLAAHKRIESSNIHRNIVMTMRKAKTLVKSSLFKSAWCEKVVDRH